MVCAFQGWNDAGDAASSAVSFLAASLESSRFARIDSEEFYDFQANRPSVQFNDDNEREIVWPTVEMPPRTSSPGPTWTILGILGDDVAMRSPLSLDWKR